MGQTDLLLERAFDPCIQGVQALQRQGLRQTEAAATRALRAMVSEDAVEQGGAALRGQLAGGGADDLGADREVTEQPALLGQPELGPVGEFANLADVVQEGRSHQQVGVEARMKLAELAD
jgi:hypothetical protein